MPTIPDARFSGASPVSVAQQRRIDALGGELAKRRTEALSLYRPLPFQERFHACRAKECILMKGNQTGGSVAGFVEDARAVTGQDPHGKYPKENGVLAVLGFGEKHIGRVIHRYLFRSGAFRMIRDKVTREWRVYRPWGPETCVHGEYGDADREQEAKDAPPLIPKRFIKEIAWDKRADYVFSRVELINGWQIYAHNTAGDPNQAQGYQANLVHVDEDTAMEGWWQEMVGRCSARDGLLRWTALPHSRNNEMLAVVERGETDVEAEKPQTIVLRATIFDNPYIPESAKLANIKIWQSQGEEVYRKRALGEMAVDSILMYPTFDPHIHDALKDGEPRHEVQRRLAERSGEPPNDWCRYAVIDPGHTVCAITYWTVPPEEIGDIKVCYDEDYLRNCDADMFGEAMRKKTQDRVFQEFIIDMHGAKLREIGSGVHPLQQYERALKANGVASVATGFGFRAGCDDIEGRVGRLRTALAIRPSGYPEFMFCVARCPMTVMEFRRFKKRVIKIAGALTPQDQGERRNTHAVETVEYAAAHGLPYVRPKVVQRSSSVVQEILRARAEREQQRKMKYGFSGGRGINLGPPR